LSELETDEVVKIKSTLYGKLEGDGACGNCIDTEKWVKEITPKLTIPNEYSHISIDTDAGKTYAEKHDVKEMPATEVCEIHKSGKEDCKSLIGPDSVKETIGKYIKKEVS
jgi:hypothetical protein